MKSGEWEKINKVAEWVEAVLGTLILLGLIVYWIFYQGLNANVKTWEMGLFSLAFIFIVHTRSRRP